MENHFLLLASGSSMAILAISLLRISWSRKRRLVWLNTAGWALMIAAAALAGQAAGAWGMAIVALFGMGAAFVFLLRAAATSPSRAAMTKRGVDVLPRIKEPLHLGARCVTFLLTGPCALAISVAIGVACRGLSVAWGWSEANANALGLFLPPLAWAILLFLLLVQKDRLTQLLILVASGLPALGIIAIGGSA